MEVDILNNRDFFLYDNKDYYSDYKKIIENLNDFIRANFYYGLVDEIYYALKSENKKDDNKKTNHLELLNNEYINLDNKRYIEEVRFEYKKYRSVKNLLNKDLLVDEVDLTNKKNVQENYDKEHIYEVMHK